MQSFKTIQDMQVTIEFPEIPAENQVPDEEALEQEKFERLLEQQLRASNRAINEARNIEEKISTESYVQDIMKDLESNRSEEWIKQHEEMLKSMKELDLVPVEQKPESKKEEKEFSGPTNISYSFKTAPFDRKTLKLPVPVYRCRGGGTVEVHISVDQLGNVSAAKAKVISASIDPDCLAEIAEKYSKMALFEGNLSAPSNHQGIIRFDFIAQ